MDGFCDSTSFLGLGLEDIIFLSMSCHFLLGNESPGSRVIHACCLHFGAGQRCIETEASQPSSSGLTCSSSHGLPCAVIVSLWEGVGCRGKPEPGSNLPSSTDQPWGAGQSPLVLLKPIISLSCSKSSPQDPEELCAWEGLPFFRWGN